MCCSSPSMTNSPGSMAKIRLVLVKLALQRLVQRAVKVDSENVTLIGQYLAMLLSASCFTVGADSGAGKRQSQQPIWDLSERSGRRSAEDLRRSQKK